MGSKMSGKALQKLDVLDVASRKLDRVHALVEQFAAAKTQVQQDQYAQMISRAAIDTSNVFMLNGYGVMADSLKQVSTVSRRGGDQRTRSRYFRELLSSARAAVEHARKMVVEGEKEEKAEPED